MIKNEINAVADFHHAFGIESASSPTVEISEQKILLRYNLMKEENEEYLKNNLELKDKILKLQNEKKILEDEKLKLDQEFDEINKKVESLIDIIKNSYYE